MPGIRTRPNKLLSAGLIGPQSPSSYAAGPGREPRSPRSRGVSHTGAQSDVTGQVHSPGGLTSLSPSLSPHKQKADGAQWQPPPAGGHPCKSRVWPHARRSPRASLATGRGPRAWRLRALHLGPPKAAGSRTPRGTPSLQVLKPPPYSVWDVRASRPPVRGHHLWVTVVPLSQGHGNTGDAVLFGAE